MILKFLKYISVIAVLPFICGCTDNVDDPNSGDNAGILTITLRNSNASRSTESDNSEVLIKNAVIALYPDAYGEDQPAVALQTFDAIDKSGSATVQMKLTDDMVQTLFGGASGARCKLYAVANIDNLADVAANASISSLKSISVGSSFDIIKVQPSFAMSGLGGVTYTLSGGNGTASGSVDLIRTAAKISLNVKLPESVVDADGAEWVPAISSTGGMRAFLVNGVKRTDLVPSDGYTPQDDDYFIMSLADADAVRGLSSIGVGEYSYRMDVPLYTYPNHWTETPEEKHRTSMTLVVPWQKRGEQRWNTFYYQVPVTDLVEIVSNHSYSVNLNVGMLGSLSPETPEELDDLSYQIVDWNSAPIDVNITDTRYLVVSPKEISVNNEENMIVPFYTSHPVEISNVELQYSRFNYYSDGNGTVVDFTVTNEMIIKSNENSGSDKKLCIYSVEKDALGNNILKVMHPLTVWEPYNSSGGEISLTGQTVAPSNLGIDYYKPSDPAENAFSPYKIIVTIRHIDKKEFTQTITITQYPSIYIEPKNNPGGSYNTGYSSRNVGSFWNPRYEYTPTTSPYGFVYVNPTYNTAPTSGSSGGFGYWDNSSDLGDVLGLAGNNSNPNMYVINVSILGDNENKYVIGDPRSLNINNNLTGTGSINTSEDLNNTWSVDADALYENSAKRKLRYYYPTIENESDNYAYMIAPKIRVASSYGKTYTINRTNCRRRAASYQEQGCPAGRWRLPTLGEFMFITQLSAEGKIPALFNLSTSNSSSYYMTAQGAYKVENKNGKAVVTKQTSNSNTLIRAVYDEWYWEQQSAYQLQRNASGGYDFTWGDVPRDATRSAMLINSYKSKMTK